MRSSEAGVWSSDFLFWFTDLIWPSSERENRFPDAEFLAPDSLGGFSESQGRAFKREFSIVRCFDQSFFFQRSGPCSRNPSIFARNGLRRLRNGLRTHGKDLRKVRIRLRTFRSDFRTFGFELRSRKIGIRMISFDLLKNGNTFRSRRNVLYSVNFRLFDCWIVRFFDFLSFSEAVLLLSAERSISEAVQISISAASIK